MDASVKTASAANASALARRECADVTTDSLDDSLRRYEPDQVLRDSLSLRPTWAGTPVTGEV